MGKSLTKKEVSSYHEYVKKIKGEFSKIIVGQNEILEKLLIVLMCRGHVLIEGVPGIAKTLIVKTLATVSGCGFSRIQFTPDLLPSDITGVETYDPKHKFYIIKGPIFSNFVLADEINRASPKTQSALLEAMQEKQSTIGRKTYPLKDPFFVVATQNPVESIGVYNLPEAQLDRFFFKLQMGYPPKEEEEMVLDKNISVRGFEHYRIKSAVKKEDITKMQEEVNSIYISKELKKYIIDIIDATRKPKNYGIEKGKFIEFGSSPRGSISLFMASKAHALVKGKTFVTPQNVKEIAHDVLRHRIILNYEAHAENITTDDVIAEVLKKVPTP